MTFDPPAFLAAAFTLLTAVVVTADIVLVRRAAPQDRAGRWTLLAIVLAASWLAGHAALAAFGVLEGNRMPPPVMPYLVVTMALAVWAAFSSVGARLATLPLPLLVGLQSFRLPLEIILHALHDAGALPVQMTWSGYNFDVATGASALVLAVIALRWPIARMIYWLWNIAGFALLVTVVTIAVLSTPLPFRQFMNDPAVVLPFHVPWNWIVNVHVWTALVGHLVIFRALRKPGVTIR